MNTGQSDIDAFIEAAARLLSIPVDPAWKPAIRENLSVIFAHAGRVADFPLPDEAQPASVFTA